MKKEIVFGLVLSAVAVMGYASGNKQVAPFASSESEGIFYYKVGQYDVYMLVEGAREGNAGILMGADGLPVGEELLQQYIPAGGFMHTGNAFLVKASKKIYLVDMGTGADDVLLGKLAKLKIEPSKIDAVLLTHLHGDHFGGLQKDGKAYFPNAKIYLSGREKTFFTETNVNGGAVAALAPYGNKVETFEPAELGATLKQILPGISPIANYGHTPGHTVYLVENGKDKLIIAGDFLHVELVQFPHPEISASYDMDRDMAAASRKQILTYAAENKIPIGGMHVVYPGVGTVEADGEGFKYTAAK